MLSHLPYSPGLSPADVLILKLKTAMRGKRLKDV
jgi:hypothetical protein